MTELRFWLEGIMSLCIDFVALAALFVTVVMIVIQLRTRYERWMHDMVADWFCRRHLISVMMLIAVTVRLTYHPHDWLVHWSVPTYLVGTYILIPLLGRKQRVAYWNYL